MARGVDYYVCGRLGALAAAEVIQHVGARPRVSLAALAAEHGMGL
jgi:adenosine kinase